MKKICVPSKYKMKTMAVFALVLIVFLVQLSGVNGCSCISTDPQTQYCNSEYAIRGNVTKLTYHAYGYGFMRGLLAERFYEVEISKVYKGILEISLKEANDVDLNCLQFPYSGTFGMISGRIPCMTRSTWRIIHSRSSGKDSKLYFTVVVLAKSSPSI